MPESGQVISVHGAQRLDPLLGTASLLPLNGHDAQVVVGHASPMITKSFDAPKDLFQAFGV